MGLLFSYKLKGLANSKQVVVNFVPYTVDLVRKTFNQSKDEKIIQTDYLKTWTNAERFFANEVELK